MVPPVNLLAVATAVPPHKLEQRAIADAARQVYGRTFARFPKLVDVFINAGIETRYSARSLEWLSAPHDLAERTDAYVESASELFMTTARAALARAGISARDVDVVVTVSSTGIATPSLEARVGPEMGFRPSIMRVPVFGRGCAGGVSGLTLGARLARAEPGEVVLVVVVELCTLTSRTDRGTKSDVISSALFGDGAAAAVLRAGPDAAALRVGAAAEHTWPRTLDIMGWVDRSDRLSGDALALIAAIRRAAHGRTDAALYQGGRAATRRNSFAIPAAPRCSTRSKSRLNCRKAHCGTSAKYLRNYGNMSSPTVLFVLERALQHGLRGSAMLSALGPGFSANFLALEAAHG